MKLKSLAFGIAAVASLSFINVATAGVNGGTVHFVGEVVSAACAVDSGSQEQTVKMGQIRTAKLNSVGATGTAVGFNIVLTDCDTTVSGGAQVAFLGTTVSTNPTALAVDSSSAGSATGVGIQILDRKNTTLTLDGQSYSSSVALNNGTNTLPFQARYIATTAAVTAGTANADATFAVQYL